MARPKKVVEEVVSENVQTEEVVQETVQKSVQNKVVAMVRSEEYPEPRTANVHPEEVDEWKKHGWTEK